MLGGEALDLCNYGGPAVRLVKMSAGGSRAGIGPCQPSECISGGRSPVSMKMRSQADMAASA